MNNTFLKHRLHVRFSVLQLLLLLAWFFAAFYIGWEVYWYTKVDWNFVKWHTHLVPYAFLMLIGLTLFEWRVLQANGLMLLLSISGSLLCIEALFIILNPNSGVDLYSQFKMNPLNYYHVWYPNEIHKLKKEEFDYTRLTNSLGFSDKEWKLQKDTGIVRIITLGDSFTEGDAAPNDSAYPALLQTLLGSGVEVMNAGTCGSDPVFNYKNLEDRLIKYQPNILVQTISEHDLFNDFAIRGGFERYSENGKIYGKPTPAWVYPALLSNIVRNLCCIAGYDRHRPIKNSSAYNAKLESLQQQLVHKYDSLGNANGFTTLWVILPMRHETQHFIYDYDFSPLKKMVAATKHSRVVDLMPCYQSCINSTTNDYQTYYWKIDGHHNPTGYRMMAQCIADAVKL